MQNFSFVNFCGKSYLRIETIASKNNGFVDKYIKKR